MPKIIIGGDLFPNRNNRDLFVKGDVDTLFGPAIRRLFAEADLRICNLEGALTDSPARRRKTGPVITAPTAAVAAYCNLGIDCLTLANNHITDGAQEGLIDTIDTLNSNNIKYIGAGLNATDIRHHAHFSIGGSNVVIYNVAETMYNQPSATLGGAWLYDELVGVNEIKELRNGCDLLIVIYHGGIEKFPYPSPEMRKRFHRMADAGADIILAQHTHCIGAEEHYNESYLLYGQGNLLLNDFKPAVTNAGLIVEIDYSSAKPAIRKHLIHAVGDRTVAYDEKQDLTFQDRLSARLDDELYVSEQLNKFCLDELYYYLNAYKSPSRLMRLLRKHFPARYRHWLYTKAFRQNDLMFALHTLRSEQNRETAIIGLERLLGL